MGHWLLLSHGAASGTVDARGSLRTGGETVGVNCGVVASWIQVALVAVAVGTAVMVVGMGFSRQIATSI